MGNKLPTRKRQIINVDELNAYKVAYEEPLESKDYIFYIGVPALILGGFTFILLYYWWLSLIMVVVGGFYGAMVFLPKAVQRNYEVHSFKERNKFLNNMTQILTDESMTVQRALVAVTGRAGGEFQEDLKVLQARLLGADGEEVVNAFRVIEDKYIDDVIFVQYIEQLETVVLEGRTNLDTLKDIKDYHNDVKQKQDEYMKLKMGHLMDMRMLMGIIVVFILAISFAFGFQTYIEAFARTPIGWITVGIYLLLMGQFFRTFSTYIFDDTVMEVER